MVELMTQHLHSHKTQNFKTVVQSQVELRSCKVEKLDASMRPLFANPVTLLLMCVCVCTCVCIYVYTCI